MSLRARYAGRAALVTGGAGFVGSHLVDRLVQLGARVTVVDNEATGAVANLAAAVETGAVEVLRADICDWQPGPGSLDFVFNLASAASPVHYQRLALATLRAGSAGTDRMLAHAHAHGAVFLQASTSEVYGDPQVHPQPESYWGHVNPVGDRSMYDEAKRCGEAFCSAWQAQGAHVRIARIFNTYGPRMALADGRVVPNFIAQALRGEPLTIYGDGLQTRSFCFVSDLVDGLLRLAASDLEGPVNLGNPEERTILDFAGVVCDLTGAALRTLRRPLPPDDPTRRCPDITRATEGLGWQPTTTLHEGLAATIEDFRSRLPT